MPPSLRESKGAPVNFFSLIDIITGVTGVLILVTLLLATKVGPPDDGPDPSLRQQLERLLDTLSSLNLQNQQMQQRIAVAQAAPSTASLESEIEDLLTRIGVLKERNIALDEEMEKAKLKERQSDAILGLTALREQLVDLQTKLKALQESARSALDEMARWEERARQAEARLLLVQRDQNKLWVIPEASTTSKEPLLVVVSGRTATIERFNKPDSKITLNLPANDRQFRDTITPFSSLDYYLVFYVKPSGIAHFSNFKDAAKNAKYDVGYDALEEQTEVVFSNR